MILTLPDDPALVAIPEEELQLELACALFAKGRLSRGVAARVASLDRLAFDEELFRRQIPSYTEDMLEEDMLTQHRLFPR